MSNNDKASFTWVDVNRFALSVGDGDICLATALGQFGAVVRDSVKVMEDRAADRIKRNLDRKMRLENMEKLVKDLTEKCQCMQQALLYKEEKYDEKCREVERYKVICELSARTAVNEELYYASTDENKVDANNNTFNSMREPLEPFTDRDDMMSIVSRGTGKKIKLHTKMATSSSAQSSSKNPAPPPAQPSRQFRPPDIASQDSSTRMRREENTSKMAAYYIGGPTRRPQRQSNADVDPKDVELRQQFNIIGGINVNQSSRPGPVPVNRLLQQGNFDMDDRKKSSKIALVGQRNEVMSSSRNAAQMMRQKLTEKGLHRQVAEGPWNRMASRRKKEWPF